MTREPRPQGQSMTPTEISPPAVTLVTGESLSAAGQALAMSWSLHSGDVIVLNRRGRRRAADNGPSVVRVLLADGDRLVRAALRELLEGAGDIEVAAEAPSGDEALALAGEIRPDVIVMNVRLPGLGGLDVARRIAAQPALSYTRVLIMSRDERDEDVFGALRAGASGFLTRDTEPAELLGAVRTLAGGGVQLSPSITRRLIDDFASQPDPRRATPEPFTELTVREREVVALVASGLSNHEIAGQLVVSPATAKTHVSHAMVKLHAHDRAQLVALAYKTGFVRAWRPQAWPRREQTVEAQRREAVATAQSGA